MTCKHLHEKASSVFWKASLQSIKTDLSHANLFCGDIAFVGFDEYGENFGEGYKWGSHRHQSGHLINPQEHPAVKQLSSILCQLVNCKSFEIYGMISQDGDQPDYCNFRPTDSITVLLDIIARAHLPVTAFTVHYMHDYGPDPQRLQVPDKDQFLAVGQHLEELNLFYAHDHDIVRDWTFNILCHAPNLRTLHLKNLSFGYPELIHRLASVDGPWSQLQEVKLRCIPAAIEDLMVLLRRCRHSLQVLKIRTMIIDGNVEEIKHMLWTLSAFPKLESVSFENLRLGAGAALRYGFIHFPVVNENPFVDELQGANFEFETNDTRRWPRVVYVAYSGPKIDVALDILARTVEGAPRDIC